MCIFILLGCSAVVSTFHDKQCSEHTQVCFASTLQTSNLEQKNSFRQNVWKSACLGALWEKQVLVGGFFSQYNVFLLGHAKERSILSGYVDKEAYVLQSPKGDKNSKHPYLLKNSCIQFFDYSYLGYVFRNYFVFLFSERKHYPHCIEHFLQV